MRWKFLWIVVFGFILVTGVRANTVFRTNLPQNTTWSLIVMTTTSNSVVYNVDYDRVNITSSNASISSTDLPEIPNASGTYEYLAIYDQDSIPGIVHWGSINNLTFTSAPHVSPKNTCTGFSTVGCAASYGVQELYGLLVKGWGYLVELGKAVRGIKI